MRRVALDASLQHRYHLVRKLFERAVAVRDGRGLQAVELVEFAVERGVGDEVVDIVVFGGEALSFVDEGRGAGEGVVDGAD